MAQINLLPWREERRQQLKKDFFVSVGLVVTLAGVLVLLADRIVANQIDSQESRNAYISKNIKTLDKAVREIRDLQKRRNQL